MGYIVLIGPKGERRITEEEARKGYRLLPGEVVSHSEPGDTGKLAVRGGNLLLKLAGLLGVTTADFITVAAEAFDKTGLFGDTFKKCPRCRTRDTVLRAIEKLGTLKSMYLVAKTILKRELNPEEKKLVETLEK